MMDPATEIKEDAQSLPRPRRRAASVAVGSLKEQPIGKKLRQGDPSTSSIYSDTVTKEVSLKETCNQNINVNRKSSTGTRRSKKIKK